MLRGSWPFPPWAFRAPAALHSAVNILSALWRSNGNYETVGNGVGGGRRSSLLDL